MISMNETNRKPGRTIPLNGKPLTFQNVEAAGLTEEELELQRAQADIDNRREEIQRQKEAAATEVKNRLTVEMNKAKDAAAGFRKEARETKDESEKRKLYEWASEADLEVARLAAELGIVRPDETAQVEKKSFFRRNRWATAFLQVMGALAAILYFHGQFTGFSDYINEINRGLPVESKLQPYDVTSIQKLFYEKMVVFIDLPIALLLMFLIVPFIGFYVLPFLKSRKDFYTEFFEDLTPWQRSLLTTIFSLGLLLFLALSHNVKP